MSEAPELAAEVAAVADDALLDLLSVEWQRLCIQQARVWAVMAEIAARDPMPGRGLDPDQLFDCAADEIRAELVLTRRGARAELEHATSVLALPRVAEAMTAGLIDRRRAIVLADACAGLSSEQVETLLDRLLPAASHSTPTGLASAAKRVAVALDPGWAERRYRQAVRERRVIGYLNDDGSATVSGQYLPAEQAATACARIDALAAAAKRAGAAATTDHLRVEVFLGLLDGRFRGFDEQAIIAELLSVYPPSGTAPAGPPAPAARGLHVRVGLATLLDLDDEPGELVGWGPLTASLARELTARQHRSEWRYAIHDSDGKLLHDGTTARRPAVAHRAPPEGVVVPHRKPPSDGIVELLVPVGLLGDAGAQRHPAWSGVISDLRRQFERGVRPVQDPAARFPGRPLRRHVQTRFQRCVFKGCRHPATMSDIDHTVAYRDGGRTTRENTAPNCRHDHRLQDRGWRLVRIDGDRYRWTSPFGRHHDVQVPQVAPRLPAPIPRRMRAADDDEDVYEPPWTPTFEALDRRGRPLPVAQAEAARPPPGEPPF